MAGFAFPKQYDDALMFLDLTLRKLLKNARNEGMSSPAILRAPHPYLLLFFNAMPSRRNETNRCA